MEPLVSVLMPVYNHARYVAEAVASVAGQDYPNVELVAVDDGSTDESADAVEAALAAHPGRFARAVVERQPNRGVTPTLNRLVGMCRGDVLVMLASDDFLLPGALTHRVRLLEAHAEALAVFTDCVVVDGAGRQTHASGIRGLWGGDPAVYAANRHLAAAFALKWAVPGPVIAVRRAAYDPAVGVGLYDEGLRYEDLDFYLRLAARGALRFDPAVTAAYRWHGANASGSRSDADANHDEALAALAKNLPAMRGWDRLVGGVVLGAGRHLHLPRRDPRRLFWSGLRRVAGALHRRRLGL